MKKRIAISLILVSSFLLLTGETLTSHVNPFIGSTNYGSTNPGAATPHGLMSVSPFNVMGSDQNRHDKDHGWWYMPYEVHNTYLTGFSHVNLSGVGCPEVASLLLMATSDSLDVDYHTYGSTFSHEKASPGYYATTLDRYGIEAEATVTPRTSVTRFTFPDGRQANVLLNLGQGMTNETGATVRRVSATEWEGSKLCGTFCYNSQAVFPLYFVMRVNVRPTASGYWKMQPDRPGDIAQWDPDNGKYKVYTKYGRDISGDDLGVWLSWKPEQDSTALTIDVSMAVSLVSAENARLNLETEQKGLTFEQMRSKADQDWEEKLGRIRVEGGTDDDKAVFYTALYHALIHPTVINDVNGQYPLMESDGVGTVSEGCSRYSVFSLWDTCRNLHQLLTLAYPDTQADMLQSMVDMYREWGWLPKWELFSRETFTMDGDPALPVLVDGWAKGLDFDYRTAYEGMVKSATTPGADNPIRPDNDPYLAKGWIPVGLYAADSSGDNSVSHALEYYVADAALAKMASALGDKKLAKTLRERSKGYRHYYSPESGTLRPLCADGSFLTPFNPRQGENFEPVVGFHEGSAWNYTFYVPHDIQGLAKTMGGEKKFLERLQYVFDQGLYDPNNEPDITYPYIFTRFPGNEWRTQQIVPQLLKKHFSNSPDGLPGNDDTGTLSAWAMFAMMGLYPDDPTSAEYVVSLPLFDKVTIGDSLVIERANPGSTAPIKSITLGGRKAGFVIGHLDLLRGKTLVIDN